MRSKLHITTIAFAVVWAAACGGDESGRGRRGAPDDGMATMPGGDGDGDGMTAPTGPGESGEDTPIEPVPSAPESKCNDCFEASAGDGGDAFDPDGKGQNVGLDADGNLVLKFGTGSGSKYIWIANTGQHTVSKVNVETFMEEGRYLLDSGTPGANGGNFGIDPSRTSVSLEGDAFVGSRGGSALTRVSALGMDCPDTNGDGMVTTSSGATDILPWGQDDCVLWQTQLAGKIRGVAAQDIPGETIIEEQLDGPPKITVTAGEHYVWAGSNNDGNSSQLWKMDAATGDILITMQPPTHVYGLAMSGEGILYTTGGYHGGNAGWIDTAQCVDDASCAVAPCTVSCTPGNCPGTCDGSAVGLLQIIPGSPKGQFYGITVDCKQRVWMGAHNNGLVRRYDPSLPSAERLITVPGTAGVGGIAADRNGWIWAGRWDIGSTLRMHAETLAFTPVPNSSAHGVGIDGLGRIWHIPISGNTVTVTEPGPGMMDAANIQTLTGFVSAYTYSDMTGEQLRLATNEPGSYRESFGGCEDKGATEWKQLFFEADLPDGTWVVFRARVADKKGDLAKADWIEITAIPGVESPVDIETYLKAAGVEGDLIEVEIEMLTEKFGGPGMDGCTGEAEDGATPKLKNFGVRHTCTQDLN